MPMIAARIKMSAISLATSFHVTFLTLYPSGI